MLQSRLGFTLLWGELVFLYPTHLRPALGKLKAAVLQDHTALVSWYSLKGFVRSGPWEMHLALLRALW